MAHKVQILVLCMFNLVWIGVLVVMLKNDLPKMFRHIKKDSPEPPGEQANK